MIDTQLDADGVLLASINMPGRAMNVFSRDLMDALSRLMDRAREDASVKAVVLTSGKDTFLAGADLEMIKMFTERARTGATEDLNNLFGHLGRIFRQLELHPKPFVAAINGLALGGGLEVCLACKARVVVDDPGVLLGLPEIKLGLLPGAGGTQRLPRLIGIEPGLRMLLTGEPVAAAKALQLGLVDEVVPADQLIATAKRHALALALNGHDAPWDRENAASGASPFEFVSANVTTAVAAELGISDYKLHRYPAYRAIIQCVADGWDLPMTMACDNEMDIFVQLMRNPVAGNMVRSLFLNRQKAAKLGLLKPDSIYANGSNALLPQVRAARQRAEALHCDEEQTLLAMAFAALFCWENGQIEQPELADVAVVNVDLFPSWTGGPFNYIQQMGAEALRTAANAIAAKDPQLFAVPDGLDRFLQPLATIAA